MTVFATPADAQRHWADAADLIVGTDDTRLTELLAVAQVEIESYAVELVLAEGDPVPVNYMLATIYQARDIYDAGRADSTGRIGIGDGSLLEPDLSQDIRRMLPKRAPSVG